MREDPESAGRDALLESYLRTSESALRRRPHRDVPVKRGSAILHVSGEDFCTCTAHSVPHSVPREAFHSIPDGHKKLVLQHFSSCWLDESCACIRQMHQRLLAQSDAAWEQTVAVVREFFEFHPPNTPSKFQSWIGRALAAEVAWLDERMALGLPSHGPLNEWKAIAASIAGVFERQIEITLQELRLQTEQSEPIGRPDSPLNTSSADSVEPDSKLSIDHAKRGGRPRNRLEKQAAEQLAAMGPVTTALRGRRATRPKPQCFELAVEQLRKNSELTLVEFCRLMDRKAAQFPNSQKYLPPKSWRVRSFFEQYKKRSNTVSRFLSDVRKSHEI
jgi:hypothetical protein